MEGDIRRLPPSVLRFITERLDLDDLERLYSTFNFGIQKLLSFPGVVDLVLLTESKLVGLRRYFLCALRNVRRVEVLESIDWPLTEVPLLSTLNPLELVLKHATYTEEIRSEVYDLAMSPKSTYAGRLSRNWRPYLAGKLHRVLPRLTHLELHFKENSSKLHTVDRYRRFPKSLTSYKHVNSPVKETVISTLSPSLRAFTIHQKLPYNATQIVSMFPLLEHLSLSSDMELLWRPTGSLVRFSDSLSSLHIFLPKPSLAMNLFRNCDLKSSKISTLHLFMNQAKQSKSDDLFDFDSILPPTVVDLALGLAIRPWESSLSDDHEWQILSLPPQLTSLRLRVFKIHATLIDALHSLHQLRHLEIESFNAPVTMVGSEKAKQIASSSGLHDSLYIATSLLSRSLTSLKLSTGEFDIERSSIADLPPSLVSLTLPWIRLTWLRKLRRRCSRCHVRLDHSVELWDSPNGRILRKAKFGVPWTSTVDLSSWTSAILEKCLLQGVELDKIYIIPHRNFCDAPVEELSMDFTDESVARLFNPHYEPIAFLSSIHNALWDALPLLRVLKLRAPKFATPLMETFCFDSLASLAHLEVYCPGIKIKLPHPALHLKHFATSATITMGDFPSSLTYLDAPNLRLRYPYLRARFFDYEKLCIGVSDIKDWQISDFLRGETFNAKTRLNLQLSIDYELTGLLLPHKGDYHITWESMRDATNERIRLLLLAPMPLDSFMTSLPPSKTTLGSAVTRFTCGENTVNASLYFPTSSTVIRISRPQPWSFGDKTAANGLPYDHPTVNAFKHLSHVELRNHRVVCLLDLLPRTVRFVLVVTDSSWKELGSKMPPKLETLIIDCKPRHLELRNDTLDMDLPFALQHLPPTLKDLSVPLLDFLNGDKYNLPALKSVLFTGIVPAAALLLFQRMPTDHMKVMALSKPFGYQSHGWFGDKYPSKKWADFALRDSPALLEQSEDSVKKEFELFCERAQQED